MDNITGNAPAAERVVIVPDGVGVTGREQGVLDVVIEGNRVWSFHPVKDTLPGDELRLAPWPKELRPFLRGTGHVTVREHLGSRVLFDAEHRFDDSGDRTAVTDDAGRPLAMDKAGVLQSTFATRGRQTVDALLDGVDEVLALLRDKGGLPAFVAFGTLLGAVRDGGLIPHDFDADVGYLSPHRNPVDVVRESFELQRIMARAGWQTLRSSTADFKVLVPDPEGGRAIDIFGGFVVDETFYLLPEVHAPYRESMITPIGEVSLEGRTFPAPADPEALLEATYGPGWRVPDPTFSFSTPNRVRRRFNGWFREVMANRGLWSEFYRRDNSAAVPAEPSAFARWVAERVPDRAEIIDLGSGTGRDALWFADNGHDVLGLDFIAGAVDLATATARRTENSARFDTWNIYDLRQVLSTGAMLAAREEPPVLYARFLPTALIDAGRHNLWRLAGMALRRGGHLFLEFRTKADARTTHRFGAHFRRYLRPDTVVAEIEAAGGRVEHREQGQGRAVLGDEDPHVCRLVATWKR